jgi:hypothetical protein
MKIETVVQPWRSWQKVLFRFFFIFCFFCFEGIWNSLSWVIQYAEYVLQYYFICLNAIADFCNRNFFHISPATNPPNGNGDYPEQWMMLYTCLLLSAMGCIIWSIIDPKRKDYAKLNYWLCPGIRYFIILTDIIYGALKMLRLQMPFPNLSQLATPLGDYLPMRFSWMFIGYSSPLSVFFRGD